MDCSPPGSLSMGFSGQKYWSWLPFPSPGDLSDPGMEPTPSVTPALAGRFFTIEPPEKPITDENTSSIILKFNIVKAIPFY